MAEPAPRLVDTPQAPVPPGGRAETFYGKDGVPLRAAYWLPPVPPTGSVVLSPGRTEPIEKYFEVVGELLQRGFVVLAHDWRGQGLSHRLLPDRMRGHAADFSHFVDDHQALLAAFADRLPRPCIALAHSMGGCLVALAMPQEPRLDAAVFTSPMFGVHLGPLPLWLSQGLTQTLVRAGAQGALVPNAGFDPLTLEFRAGNIWTHDRGRFERHRAQLRACPELALGGVTWGWLDAAFRGMDRALAAEAGAAIAAPVLLVLAGDERLVVNAASRRFAHNTPRAQVIEVTGASHEILMETDPVRAVFWQEFDRFVMGMAS